MKKLLIFLFLLFLWMGICLVVILCVMKHEDSKGNWIADSRIENKL
jgi:hypothetical protein